MNSRLAAALAANFVFVNAVILFLELAARTLSPSLHALVSAAVTIAFVVALALCERLEAHPLTGALLVPFALLVAWLAFERAMPPSVPALLVATPLLLLNVPLLRWVGRPPGAAALTALVAGASLLAIVVVLLDRRAEAREVARRDAERSAHLEARAARERELRAAALRGDIAGACELFALDPTSDFEACRRSVETATDGPERWRRLGPFFPAGAGHRMMPGLGTPAQRGWIIEAYARAWAALPDAEFVEWNGYAREALWQVRDETKRALGPDARAAMIERLEARLRADVSREDRAQLEATLAFVRALEA